ncbi:hypothetical protein ECG_08641 [Echinococcus granulosus]|nr:hypothetical protein ECG_08641 [Echinococcus granulosus]
MRAVNISEIEVALLMSLLRCLYVYAQWCRARRRCLCASSTEWNGRRASAEAGKCASDEPQLLSAPARTTTSVGKEWRKITPVTILCVSEEEQREEFEEEAEEEDVDWSTSMTPPLSASLTPLSSPVLPPPSPLPSPICPSRLGGLDMPYSTCSISSFPTQLLAFIHHIHSLAQSPLLSHESPLRFLLCEGEEVGDVAEDMSIAAAGRSGEDETAMMASYWETPSGDELSEFTTPSSPHHMAMCVWGHRVDTNTTQRCHFLYATTIHIACLCGDFVGITSDLEPCVVWHWGSKFVEALPNSNACAHSPEHLAEMRKVRGERRKPALDI